jgi:hypothetical protein
VDFPPALLASKLAWLRAITRTAPISSTHSLHVGSTIFKHLIIFIELVASAYCFEVLVGSAHPTVLKFWWAVPYAEVLVGSAHPTVKRSLMRHLRLDVAAEGVETLKQFLQLKTLGCNYAQGYLFPVDGKTAETLARLPLQIVTS